MDNFNLLLNELDKVKRILFLSFTILLLSIILIFFFTFLYRKVLKKEKKVLKNIIKQLYANIVFSSKLKKELNSLFKSPNYKIFGGSDEDQLEYKIFNFCFLNERLIVRIEPKNINSIKFFDNDKNREFIKKRISAEYTDYQFSSFTSDRALYTLMAFKF